MGWEVEARLNHSRIVDALKRVEAGLAALVPRLAEGIY